MPTNACEMGPEHLNKGQNTVIKACFSAFRPHFGAILGVK